MVAVAAAGSETRGAGSRIAGAAAILLGGFVASRLVGLARDVVISARFGTSDDLDLYFAAFRIPDTIFTLVAGGALGSALVPVFAEYRAARHEGGLVRLAGAVFNLVALAATLAAVLGIVFAPQYVPWVFGFTPEQEARLVMLVRVMLLQPVLFGLGEVVTRYLNVHQHFVYPAIAPTLYNLAIIAAALALGPSLGTLGLALGVVAGALAYFLVQVPAAAALGFRWQPALDLHEPALRQIARLMLPRLIGQGAVQLSFIFTTGLASFLPSGRVAALNFAWVLMMLPLGTFAMSMAGAAFPTLAEQAARGEHRALAATVRRTLGMIQFVMVPSALGLIVAGLPLVQTLFQHGAFTAESSAITAAALTFYAMGLPAHGAIEILTRAFYALQDTRTPVTLGVLAMAANVALASLLIVPLAEPLAHVGIAIALSASATAEALVLLLLLRRRLPGVLTLSLVWSLSRTVLAGLVMAAAAAFALAVTRLILHLPPIVQTASAVATGGATYAAAAFVLRSPDLHDVLRMARRRLGKT
ncbi:MAG: murein biosynthesis integral membrane protein MurJ [Chloroflexota bacterium]